MPKHEKPFHLDMPFDEALRRYAQAEPREISERENKAKANRKKQKRASVSTPTGPSVDRAV